jgi:hypothetical protein
MKFKPPPTVLSTALEDLIKMFDNEFVTEKFKASISKSFVDTGMGADENGNYKIYHLEELSKGTLKMEPFGTGSEPSRPPTDEAEIVNHLHNYFDSLQVEDEENDEDEENNEDSDEESVLATMWPPKFNLHVRHINLFLIIIILYYYNLL